MAAVLDDIREGAIESPIMIIHVEDFEDWRDLVRDTIENDAAIKGHTLLSLDTVDEAKKQLEVISGPVVLIMDLRTEEWRSPFAGYDYLLTDLRELLHRNASTAVFVISGQLNGQVEQKLHQIGLPYNHIYDKGTWSLNQREFASELRATVLDMEDIAMTNMARGVSGEKVDSHLILALDSIEEERRQQSGDKQQRAEVSLLPFIIETTSPNWESAGIPDLKVLGHIQNIYSCLGSARSVVALERDAQVKKIEASLPYSVSDSETDMPSAGDEPAHPAIGETGDHAIIAIIDNGIDVLHHTFRDSSGTVTRILAIWDQTDPDGPSPSPHGFGREHTQADINRYIVEGEVPTNLQLNANGHGTHVASIAAGSPTAQFDGGVAQAANLVIVIPQIRPFPGRPYSLGYSESHLLAVQYIRDKARATNLPVVINISQGMNAGAHDGTARLEKGLDAITENGSIPGIVLVKSAGNERNQQGHASLIVAEAMQDELSWRSFAPHKTTDKIELWYRSHDAYRFYLIDPQGDTSPLVSPTAPAVQDYFPSGNRYSMRFTKRDVDNGDSRLVVEISCGQASTIALGTWCLKIEGLLVTVGAIHAWMERNDNRPISFINHTSEEVTLNIPATANHVITVGSAMLSSPPQLSPFSSLGPTRDNRLKPDLTAPGYDINGACAQTVDGATKMSGTSMAAPYVTGAIALVLSSQAKVDPSLCFNAAQIHSAITQSCKPSGSNWDAGLGHGVLDIQKFLREALE